MIPARSELRALDLFSGTEEGIALSLQCGTTTVGDISSTGVSREVLASSRLQGVVYEEAIAFDPARWS